MEWLRDRPTRITSIVSKVEVLRAVRRVANATEEASLVRRATDVLASVAITGVTPAVADRAAMADPPTLRSLDAMHLANAVLAAPLEAFVVYDDRLAEAARAAGMTVVQPGREPQAT
jgi:predicted nucleic acid-binding protein